MRFDEANLAIIDTLSRDEAKVFILFLASEILRHEEDIIKLRLLITGVATKFSLKEGEICESILQEHLVQQKKQS